MIDDYLSHFDLRAFYVLFLTNASKQNEFYWIEGRLIIISWCI
jgi:hypothetical protein